MAERRNKVTMKDIARESGVSLSTVSLVLNDKPGLPQETRVKVLNTARDMGYEVRTALPVVSRPSRLGTIGMLVKRSVGDPTPPSSNIFFSHIISGIEAGCRQENISLLYATLPVDENNRSLEIPRLVHDPRVDGLLLVGNYIDEPLHEAIKQRGIPVVLADAYACSNDYDAVNIDNTNGAYTAVKHLLEKGHRDIAFLGSFPNSRISFRYRRKGYQQALQEYGVERTYYGDCPHNNREAVINTTCRLLTENPQVTAIFGCNDEVTIIAMHGVLEAGKRVPDDVSIIGFDNNTNAENTIPPLTTMNVDKVSIGRLAVQLIVNRAENPEQGYVSMIVHPNLVERKSVRDLKAVS
jgi:LacI family transcriptional regulator